jgi:hypothetical protein
MVEPPWFLSGEDAIHRFFHPRVVVRASGVCYSRSAEGQSRQVVVLSLAIPGFQRIM